MWHSKLLFKLFMFILMTKAFILAWHWQDCQGVLTVIMASHSGVITAEPIRGNKSRHSASPDPVPSDQMDNAAVCPPGMEHLLNTSMIIVQQQTGLFEDFETKNQSAVLDMNGRRIYLAAEQASGSGLLRICLCSARPFTLLLLNNLDVVCLKVERPCTVCCNEALVYTGNDIYIGKITEDVCTCCPTFTVYDSENNKALTIRAGSCIVCSCSSVIFTVKDVNGQEVGQIQHKLSGLAKELSPDADNFGVSFPLLMDPRLKTLLLGAVLLIVSGIYLLKLALQI